jgi:hypothetical protein
MHAQGQWGSLDSNDRAANDQAVADGTRILSRYEVPPGLGAVWVITEAVDDAGDRACTTILLPEEY